MHHITAWIAGRDPRPAPPRRPFRTYDRPGAAACAFAGRCAGHAAAAVAWTAIVRGPRARRAGSARLPRPAGGAACRFAGPGRARSGAFAGRRPQWLGSWRLARAGFLIDRAWPGTCCAPQGLVRRPFGPGCPAPRAATCGRMQDGGGGCLNQREWRPCRDARTGCAAERMQGNYARAALARILHAAARSAPVQDLQARPIPLRLCPSEAARSIPVQAGANGLGSAGPGHAARPDSGPMSGPLVSWTWMRPNCASLPATSASAASVVQITDAPASRASA